MPALCNSTPHSFKDDKSQQEGKMKQWWFLVVFCSNLETFHLQDLISQYGERLWLELALLTAATGNLIFTNDIWEGESRRGTCSLCIAKGGPVRLLLFSHRLFSKCSYTMRSVSGQTHIKWLLKPADFYQHLKVCLAPQLTSNFFRCFGGFPSTATFPNLFINACAM